MVWGGGSEPRVVPTRWDLLIFYINGALLCPCVAQLTVASSKGIADGKLLLCHGISEGSVEKKISTK